jgi:hypothetical protein
MPEPKTHEGRYADLVEGKNGLTIKLNNEGREELEHNKKHQNGWNDIHHVAELLEDFTCNGWQWLRAEDIGALTGCELILTNDATIEDNGAVTVHGSIWWHERYAIESASEQLDKYGEVFFLKAVEE